MSGEWGEDNCEVVHTQGSMWGTDETLNNLFFFNKDIPRKALFSIKFPHRPIATTVWDKETRGILHKHFRNGDNLAINVNETLKAE